MGLDPVLARLALAEWWGLVEGDPIILGLVVAAIAVFALVYVISRVRRRK